MMERMLGPFNLRGDCGHSERDKDLGLLGDRDDPSKVWNCDYVSSTVPSFEDLAHLHGNNPDPNNFCWDDYFDGQGGWLEIHPTDAIRVIRPYPGMVGPPKVRKTYTAGQGLRSRMLVMLTCPSPDHLWTSIDPRHRSPIHCKLARL